MDFSNGRQLGPTTNVSRGLGASPLPRAERDDLEAISFTPLGKTEPMTWAQSLRANFTDGIVVLHRGRIVYERYFGALKEGGQHIAQSVTSAPSARSSWQKASLTRTRWCRSTCPN